MKLSILCDNYASGSDFQSEHGLSWLIETGSTKILFDTGESGIFAENAKKMGINLKEVDFLVLSHGHYDHTGGIKDFLTLNNHAPIVMKKEALIPKYHGNSYNIGINPQTLLPEERLLFVEEQFDFAPGLVAVGQIDILHPEETHFEGFQIKKDNKTLPDTFQDELYLAIFEDEKLSLMTGCSHSGVINIIESAFKRFKQKIDAVYGGFHLASSSNEEVLQTGKLLAEMSINKIVTCHCTGYKNYELLKEEVLPNLEYGFGGRVYSSSAI